MCINTNSYIGQTVVPPTQTQQGYTLHQCALCGDTYADNYVDPVVPEEPEVIILGDLNGDGYVTSMDINVLKRIVGGSISATASQILAGDFNGDGQVTAMDANALARYCAGK